MWFLNNRLFKTRWRMNLTKVLVSNLYQAYLHTKYNWNRFIITCGILFEFEYFNLPLFWNKIADKVDQSTRLRSLLNLFAFQVSLKLYALLHVKIVYAYMYKFEVELEEKDFQIRLRTSKYTKICKTKQARIKELEKWNLEIIELLQLLFE